MTYRVLVPLDGSELANRAIPWADELAGALHADVELLRVLPGEVYAESAEAETEVNRKLDPTKAGDAVIDLYERVVESERADAQLALSQARRQFRRAKSVETVMDHGSAEDVIVTRAQITGTTLIAMATHGRGGAARALLGSVADGVIRRSHVPVLVIRPDLLMPPHAPQRVLIPLDSSDLAAAVLPHVVPLARELGWTLTVYAVIDLPPPTFPIQGAAIPLGRVPDHAPAEVMDYLDQTASDLRAQGLGVEVKVGSGDRAAAIVQAARDTHSGIIAMSTHGRHGLGRWAFGSVTEAVIRHAEVPVLAVHPAQVAASSAPTASPGAAAGT